MSKSTVFVGVVAVAALGVAGASGVYTYMMNKPRAEVSADLGAVDLTTVANYKVTEADTALALEHELKGGNTRLVWQMTKTRGQETETFEGTWDVLNGAVVYDAEAQQLKAVEVRIAVDSIVGYGTQHPAPGALTETVRGKTPGLPAWFDIEQHPTAVYTADTFVARTELTSADAEVFSNAPTGWTHLIKGEFSLNGKTVDLNIPARVEFIGEELVMDLGFQIDRKRFDVDGSAVGGWTVQDTAELTATVQSAPQGDALLASVRTLSQDVAGQGAQITDLYKQQNRIAELESQLAALTEQLEKLKATGVADAGPAVDLASLPKAYTEELVYPANDETGYPGKGPFEIDMVLVPGDASAGVGPFYMATKEVAWAMFYDWAYCADIDPVTAAELKAQELRPSPLYEDCNQLKLGLEDRPAISMSRTTAEAFAKWVSERTGKKYRLPTDAEWQTALKLGGGVPSGDALLEQAVLIDNAEMQFDPPFLELTAPVGSLKPNALGIYDLLGNAAEWVTGTGSDRIVRGGYFMLESGKVAADWKAVEDQDIWNATYPQLPVSKFWYRDHYYQGIRLVCDVDSVAAE